MAFRVLGDEVSVLRKVGEFREPDGTLTGDDHDSVVRFRDDIVPDSQVAPVLIRRYAAGDPHVRSLIAYVGEGDSEVELSKEDADRLVKEQDMAEGAKKQEDGDAVTASELAAKVTYLQAETPGATQPQMQMDQQQKTLEELREDVKRMEAEVEKSRQSRQSDAGQRSEAADDIEKERAEGQVQHASPTADAGDVVRSEAGKPSEGGPNPQAPQSGATQKATSQGASQSKADKPK